MDFSKGAAFVQDGVLYYSPNCSKPVIVPPQTDFGAPSPFDQPRLSAPLFRQPLWWSSSWGWVGFVPITPSFISTPFETFCWMPVVEKCLIPVTSELGRQTYESRYRMHETDIAAWKEKEDLVVRAAHLIKLKYGISATTPPLPSSFGYDRYHKNPSIAKRMISVSRDWFGIWMGFLSYLVSRSQTKEYNQGESNTPVPCWYQHLLTRGFSDAWIEGLTSSTVCSFDPATPRSGIVLQWGRDPIPSRAIIDWLYSLHIPLWFVWSRLEEEAISRNSDLAYLRPPEKLLKTALKPLLTSPNIPLAALIIKRFSAVEDDELARQSTKVLQLSYAASFVWKYVVDHFLRDSRDIYNREELTAQLQTLLEKREDDLRRAAEVAADLPQQGMIEREEEEKSCLFNHWQDFFDARDRRQNELLLVETPKAKQARLSREKNPGIKTATMYYWQRIESIGGKIIYKRIRINKGSNQSELECYGKFECKYNAFANEWDFFEEFSGKHTIGTGFRDDDDDDDEEDSDDGNHDNEMNGTGNDDYDMDDANNNNTSSFSFQSGSDSSVQARSTEPLFGEEGELEDGDADSGQEVAVQQSYSTDVLETVCLVYGYVPTMGVVPTASATRNWEWALKTLGFPADPTPEVLSINEKNTIIEFLMCIVDGKRPPPEDLDDLNPCNYAALKDLYKFNLVERVSEHLVVFDCPKSSACSWSLGVTPAVALYVVRYCLTNPMAHTILTISHRLLQRGIPFRTLISLPSHAEDKSISKRFTPESFRKLRHPFTVNDFESAMLRCKAILTSPEGRAAVLHGGLLGRIAREFLSEDAVLDGPSIEVTWHRAGYVHPSTRAGSSYWDDSLTEDEIAVICGTYVLYTGSGDQTAVVTWFPPPSVWNGKPSGMKWVDWTEVDEQWFVSHMSEIRAGKFQPLRNKEWRDRLRGQTSARSLIENNANRSLAYLDTYCPL